MYLEQRPHKGSPAETFLLQGLRHQISPQEPAIDSLPLKDRSVLTFRKESFRCLLLFLQPFGPLLSQPLMEPTKTPFTKYFCKNGYTHRIGNVTMTVTQYFTNSR